MADSSLPETFRTFVDDDTKYRRFLEACNDRARQRGKLSISQERLWERFTIQNPSFAHLGTQEILDAFAICHVHLIRLRVARIPIRKGVRDIYYDPDYEKRLASVPYSTRFVTDSPAWGAEIHIEVFHCDDCLSKRRQMENHA